MSYAWGQSIAVMLHTKMVRNRYDVRSCWSNPIPIGRSSLLETGTTHPLSVSILIKSFAAQPFRLRINGTMVSDYAD